MTKTINLRDGRTLAYIDCGDPDGFPVFHFHGHPGSRLEALIAEKAARDNGVRLIGLDRPGMGYSDDKADRRLLDWPNDVVELADTLGLDRFSVSGASGGGPYAIVCAYRLRDRLAACGIMAGLGPIYHLGTQGMMFINRLQFALARNAQILLKFLLWIYLGRHTKVLKNQEQLRKMATRMTEGLGRGIEDSELALLYLQEMLEAFRQGCRGVAYDAYIFTQPWGFELEEISLENVYLWHGYSDIHVPVSTARFIQQKIPHCQAHYFENEDHMDVVFNHLDEVMGKVGNGANQS